MSIRERTNGTFELRVVHRQLEKPYYTTHDSREDAEAYDKKLKESLNKGLVPPELRPQSEKSSVPLSQMFRHYLNDARIAATDRPMVTWLQENLDLKVHEVTVRWTDAWIAKMKRVETLAPGTIRKRVESLARAIDWWNRRQHEADDMPANPLRMLPVGYSSYQAGDGPVKRIDVRRDRRLLPGEYEAIEAAILGQKNPNRQRALKTTDAQEFLILWRLIVNTGLRLREAYRLRVSDVRFDLRTIHVGDSKTGAARDIPMTPVSYDLLSSGILPTEPKELLFSYWDGEVKTLEKTTRDLSGRFTRLFKYVGCNNLTEHDLRHEAVCRWMMMRDSQGRWLFRPEEVRRITGHKSVQQFEVYLSLRGSDLADRLWENGQGAAPRASQLDGRPSNV